ncbi:MAG: hypothetical protein JWQ55_958, partial [Rhodopila sp.]|nr:hypothetical protein [Rhodopila sp.]
MSAMATEALKTSDLVARADPRRWLVLGVVVAAQFM